MPIWSLAGCVTSETEGLRGPHVGMPTAIPPGMDTASLVSKAGHEVVVVYSAQRIGRLAKVVGRRGHELVLECEGRRFTRAAHSCGTAYPTNNA